LLPIKDDIPTRRFPVVTVVIIAINVIVFFGFQVTSVSLDGAELKQDVVVKYAAIPYEITHPGKECGVTETGVVACQGQPGIAPDAQVPDQPPTILTIFFAMFMHGGLLHLGGNMLFLWIFGNNIEDSMNRGAFVAFYLLGGVVAMLAQTLLDAESTVPTLGASGAIAAVLGAYALLYPRARVLTLVIIIFFVTILRLPALLVLGVWVLLQFLDLSATQPTGEGGGVAYAAHIGGFLFGLAAIRLFATNVHEDYERAHRIPVY
jgi:membrane associated rhomboid family serine protease